MGQGPGGTACASRGDLFIEKFCLSCRLLTSSANQFSCTVHSSRRFLEMGQRLQGSFMVLIPLQSMPLLHLTPVLCCAYSQELQQGCLSQDGAALPPWGPFSSSNNPQLALQLSSCWCLRHQPHLVGSPHATARGLEGCSSEGAQGSLHDPIAVLTELGCALGSHHGAHGQAPNTDAAQAVWEQVPLHV